MMENIQSYGSDSHSDCSEGPENEPDGDATTSDCFYSEKEETNSKGSQGLPNCSAPSDKLFSHDISEAKDFFGLSAVDKMSPAQNSYILYDSQKDIPKNRRVNTRFGEVEVPSGDFWNEFIPDSNSEASPQHTSHDEYYRRQIGETSMGMKTGLPEDQRRISRELSHPQNFLKRPHGDKNFENISSSKKRNEIFSCTSQQSGNITMPSNSAAQSYDQDSEMCTSGAVANCHLNTATQEKRKLYYIHSKVSPYLNSLPVNKCAGKCLNTWSGHNGVINRIGWNFPNYSHLLLTAGMDTSVRVWNVWSSLDPCVAILASHKKAVKHAEWCHAGRKILSCSYDRSVHITDVDSEKVVAQCEHADFISASCVHPSNPNLFATGTDNMILMWDMRTPQAPVKYFSYKDNFGQVQDLLFIREGQELISSSDLVSRDSADRSIMAWDVKSAVVLSNQIFQERYTCSRLKLHPTGSHFMAQTQGGYVALFSTSSPYKMDKSKRYEGHKMQGYSIGFDISPDGSLVYSGSAENGVHCYDQRSGKLIRKLSSSSRRDVITDVACHPVLTSLIASSTWGGSISLWQ